MTSVLITAFEPYDRWRANSSWLAMIKLTQDLPARPAVTTRLYPVDFGAVQDKLAEDLAANYDFALHLGQAPGSTRIQLESLAINVGGSSHQSPEEFRAIVAEGPVAYRSPLPLADWALRLREAQIPAEISYHAGTYLCNATMYYSCYVTERLGLKTKAAFIHLPLDVTQTAAVAHDMAALPADISAEALRLILAEIAGDTPGV
jgi:pyroglutamyl-peptidase